MRNKEKSAPPKPPPHHKQPTAPPKAAAPAKARREKAGAAAEKSIAEESAADKHPRPNVPPIESHHPNRHPLQSALQRPAQDSGKNPAPAPRHQEPPNRPKLYA